MYRGGYTGKVLRIDLTHRTSRTEELPLQMARDFIGGAGFGIKYLFDELEAHTDPLGPGNKLVYAPGPLTGTGIPCTSRLTISAKSPLTNAIGMGLSGGYFPVEIKFAGYDVIIIEGKAEKPAYIFIKDGHVQFRDGGLVWGTNTFDCQQIIKDRLNDQNVRISCIGPAGERLSKIACIINERRAVGRRGLGAVMGSKNLKAVAIRGTGEIGVASEDKYRAARDELLKTMKASPHLYPEFSKTGTPSNVDNTCALGIFPAKNWTATGQFTPADEIGVEALQTRQIGKEPCYGCPVGCSQLRLARTGAYNGVMTEGPEFETLYSFGGTTGVDNMDSIIAADRACDEFGLDTISAGVAIGFAMELFEKGILSRADTGGLDLNFGNHEAMNKLLRQIAFREGLGDILADGVRSAAARIGKGAERYAMHTKGLELPAYDVRGAKAHGLNYATAFCGADHNRGYAFQEIFGIPIPYPVDRFAVEGKGKLTKWNQDVRISTSDCTTLCAFILDMALAPTATVTSAALVEAVTGLPFSADDIVRVGERVNNLARAFNVREGFTRADDTLPERLMTEPLLAGSSKGHYISKEDLNVMLDEYYAERGWDVKTGVPTREKLVDLGLEYAAEQLGV
jgi:aldehyde:ferredoxin oxidoreductase